MFLAAGKSEDGEWIYLYAKLDRWICAKIEKSQNCVNTNCRQNCTYSSVFIITSVNELKNNLSSLSHIAYYPPYSLTSNCLFSRDSCKSSLSTTYRLRRKWVKCHKSIAPVINSSLIVSSHLIGWFNPGSGMQFSAKNAQKSEFGETRS